MTAARSLHDAALRCIDTNWYRDAYHCFLLKINAICRDRESAFCRLDLGRVPIGITKFHKSATIRNRNDTPIYPWKPLTFWKVSSSPPPPHYSAEGSTRYARIASCDHVRSQISGVSLPIVLKGRPATPTKTPNENIVASSVLSISVLISAGTLCLFYLLLSVLPACLLFRFKFSTTLQELRGRVIN